MTDDDASAVPELPPRVDAALGMRFDALRDYAIIISFVGLFVALALSTDAFLTRPNLLNILNQQAPLLIIAAAVTLVIIAGGFDVSVGAIFALAGVVSAKVALDTGPYLGLLAGVGVGALCGICNGFIVTIGRINSFIATLATTFIFRGIAVIITGGSLIIADNSRYTALGQNNLFGVKIAIWVMAVFVVMISFLLARTVFGRSVYACGDNAEAARLAGLRVGRVRGATFTISGAAAGVAGVISSSRVATGEAGVGVGLEFTAIAAIVVGGTSLFGGEGAIWRTVVGVLLIALIGNGFILLAIDPIYQQVVQGLIIIAAVSVDAWSRVRRS